MKIKSHAFTLNERASGVLLHPSSFPSRHGIGDFGPEAYRFVDFLAQSGQRWWQTFPLGPTGAGNSPYQTLSVFAGNPLLISLDLLAKDGLLSRGDLSNPIKNTDLVDYYAVQQFKFPLLHQAFQNFEKKKETREYRRYLEFCSQEKKWLSTYALFKALKTAHYEKPWWEWAEPYRKREPRALQEAEEALQAEIHYEQFLQYEFFKQWDHLKSYCEKKDIGVIGDIPIFVAHDSADVWANPSLFYLDNEGHSIYMAGVPPDYFSRTGQLWGNPLYRWDVLKKRGYDWWVGRFKMAFRFSHAVRLDHFIGFYRHWAVPGGAATAEHGHWLKGPRSHFFKTVLKKCGPMEIIAEDLGIVIDEVKKLRDEFAFPGMRVLQFAFGNDPEAQNYLPHSYIRRCVVYTGTHDNDTTVGWFNDVGSKSSTRSKRQIKAERAFTMLYANSNGHQIHWDLIHLALMSVADTAIIPAQDLLGLGTRARMNRPGTGEGNWRWRLMKGALTSKIAERMFELTQAANRLPPSKTTKS